MASPQTENGYTRIANELLEQLCKIRINGEARQMLDAIFRKTYGYQKREAPIPTLEFQLLTGLPPYAIHKARAKLISLNLITVTQKGYSQVLTYSIQKDYEKWQPLPKKVTVTQKGYSTVTQKGYRCNPKRLETVTQKGNRILHKSKENISLGKSKEKKESTKEKRRKKPYMGTSQKPNPQIKEFLQYHCDKHNQFFGAPYLPDWAKDGAIVKGLFKFFDLEQLKALDDKFLTSHDRWCETKTGYTIGMFKKKINQLVLNNPDLGEVFISNLRAAQSWLKRKEKEDEEGRA